MGCRRRSCYAQRVARAAHWLLVLLAALGGCGRSSPASGPDVVVVLVDALRADRLGPWGATGPTPAVDAFAAEAVVFDGAIAPSAWTVPSVASLMTGLHPQSHRVLKHRSGAGIELDTLSPELLTLAEVFDAAGYRTGALLKSRWIDAEHGFAQGFDEFRWVPGDRASGQSAAELTAAAVEWLGRSRGSTPVFLYLHYMDPHSPYQAPEPRLDPALLRASEMDGSHEGVARFKEGEAVPTEADVALLRARYDAEVHYLDQQLGELFEVLGDEAVVALVADHGEQLHEHGGWFHEHLWQENLHVPLVVRAPGLEPGRVEGWVSTVGLGATLVELAGLQPPPSWEGRSLVDEARAGRARSEPVFAEYGAGRAVLLGHRKLILAEGDPALYDMAADPGERVALEPDTDLEALIRTHLEQTRERGRQLGGTGSRPLTDEQVEELRRLGYLD